MKLEINFEDVGKKLIEKITNFTNDLREAVIQARLCNDNPLNYEVTLPSGLNIFSKGPACQHTINVKMKIDINSLYPKSCEIIEYESTEPKKQKSISIRIIN